MVPRTAQPLLLCAALLACCSPDPVERTEEEPEPCVGAGCEGEPMQPPVVTDDAVWSDVLGATSARGLFALGDGVLAQGEDALFYQEASGPRPVAATEQIAGGSLRAVAALGQDTLILSTDERLWSLTPEGLSASPIASHFAQAPPAQLAVDGDALWLLGPAGLFRWAEGELVRLDRVQLGGDVLGLIASPTGRGVWASTKTHLHALGEDEAGGVTLATSPVQRGAEQLVAASGAAWALVGGVVYRIGADGSWQQLVMDAQARGVVANAAAEDVWVEDIGGRVWHFGGGQVVRVAQAVRWGDARVVDAHGGLIVSDGAGLVRHTRRLEATLVSVPLAPINEAAEVRVAVSFPERVEAATLKVGDVTLELAIDAMGQGSAMVEPGVVGPGKHALTLVVRFKGGAQLRRTARIEVAPFDFTWGEHIKPLYEQSCARCHGTQASRPLDTRERWIELFDGIDGDARRGILNQVTQKIMPLPPTPSLGPQQIKMLEQWREQGFLP